MAIITTEQLDSYCRQAVDNAHSYSFFYGVCYLTQFNIGCRWIELYDLSRWSFSETYGWQLQPAKGNNLRTSIKNDLSEDWTNILLGDMTKMDYCRYSSFTRSFRFLFPVWPVYCGEKDVTSHIFRYNKFKQLYEVEEQSIDFIKSYMGEVETLNVNTYINAVLHT